MNYNILINRFYEDVDYLGFRFPVAEISKATGFGKPEISKILNKKKEPSGNFLTTFYEKYGERLKGKADNIEYAKLKNEAAPIGEKVGEYENNNNQFDELDSGLYRMKTKLVTVKARAGYLLGYGDHEYVDELPTHEVIVSHPHQGVYMSFEIEGDSMDDGSKRSIENGSIATGRLISRVHWKNKLHLHKFQRFIIVSYEGILCKEIINHDVLNGVITCHSLNPDKKEYPDFDLALRNVMQIFNIVKISKDE